MVVSTKAIVFSALKYAEADLIVCCYTEIAGIKSYLLRGVLKSKKGRLKPSLFQPLTQLELVASHKDQGRLEYIKEAKILSPYKSLHTEVPKAGLVLFLAEMLKTCIKEEEANKRLYAFLETALDRLDESTEIANFHIYFLLQLSAHLGFYPDADAVDTFGSPAATHLKAFFDLPFNEIGEVKLGKQERLETLELLLWHYKLHVQGYKNPKSLAVLRALFG